MKKLVVILLAVMSIGAFAQKSTVENICFRNGDATIPFPGKGSITLNTGENIKGEFRQGMMVKMNKWQWYDESGKLQEIKEADVKRIVFYPDQVELSKVKGPEIELNISLGGNKTFVPQSIPFNIAQPKDFDFVKAYEPIVMDRVTFSNGKSTLLVLVNNGWDSKIKVYVYPNKQQTEYGRDANLVNTFTGGGEAGAYYNGGAYLLKPDGTLYESGKDPGLLKEPLFKNFKKKRFERFFGDNEEFMALYPQKERKFKKLAEYVWVYNHLNQSK